MMATTNPITGDSLINKATSQEYRDNYDSIFKKKEKERSKCNCEKCSYKLGNQLHEKAVHTS